MKVYFNNERMKLKKKKLSKEEREFADPYWDKVVNLSLQKNSKIKITIEVSPCCRKGIGVRLGEEGEWCLECGKKIIRKADAKKKAEYGKRCADWVKRIHKLSEVKKCDS